MKTTNLQLLISILALFLLASAGIGFSAEHSNRSDVDIEFLVALDMVAAKTPHAMVYYRCAPDRFAKSQEEPLHEFFGKAAFLEIAEVSGGIFAADMNRLWANPPKLAAKGIELKEEKALTASNLFLDRINGVPESKTSIYFSGDKMNFIQKNGNQHSVPAGWNVTYRRLLKNFEVLGPGGKIKLFMNPEGDIIGYMRVWRELTPEKQSPIISVYEAAEIFKNDPVGRALIADVEKINVTDMKLAYLEMGISMPQRYLQPVYFVRATAYSKKADGDFIELPYTRYIAALKEPPEALWPKGREYKSQERIEKKYKPGDDE